MSSILDALKKSEAERQRGTPPTLDSPAAFRRRPVPARRRPAWLLPVLAVAALAGAWYGGLLPWPAPGTTPDPTAAAAPAGEPAADAGATAAPAAPDPAAVAAAPVEAVPAPAPAAAPPVQDPVVDGATPSRGFYSGGARADVQDLPVVAEAAPAPVPAPAPAEAVPPPPVEPQPAPPAATPDPAAPAPSTPAPDPAATASAAPAPPAGIPSIHELPFAMRRELPELKVTMHLYSADPARRLVLLNGVRARDGDTLEGGLEVVAIRAADVVLRFQGTEFVLPLRG